MLMIEFFRHKKPYKASIAPRSSLAKQLILDSRI